MDTPDTSRHAATAARYAAVGVLPEPRKELLDNRAPASTLLATSVIARAAQACATALDNRRVIVRCDSKLAITAQPNRLHELLVGLIEESARREDNPCDVRLTALRSGNRAVLEIDGGPFDAASVTRLYGLTLSVRGRLEIGSDDHSGSALRVHIPQSRSGDLPDDVA